MHAYAPILMLETNPRRRIGGFFALVAKALAHRRDRLLHGNQAFERFGVDEESHLFVLSV
jgi:hypothetical protein